MLRARCLLASGLLTLALSHRAAAQRPPAGTTPAALPSAPVAGGGDAVVLKDGGTLRGTLVEVVPERYARIQVADGRIATVQWSVIARIDRQAAEPTPPAPAAQPVAAAPPEGPRQLAYHDGDTIPAGYHVEAKPRLGLIITGAILSTIALAIPVAYAASTDHSQAGDLGIVLATTLFAAPGVPLLIVGLASIDRRVLIRDDAARTWSAPVAVGPGAVGLAGGFRF